MTQNIGAQNVPYPSGSEAIQGYGPLLSLESTQVFGPGLPATLGVGSTGGGKTIAVVDMFYANADVITEMTLYTNSYDSPTNGYLRDMIPRIVVKNWDLGVVCQQWGAILERGLAITRGVEDSAVNQFIAARCRGNRMLEGEIAALYEIANRNQSMFPSVQDANAALAAHEKLIKLEFIGKHFRSDDRTLSDGERLVVQASRSTKPCPCIVFDDITAQLAIPSNDEYNVPTVGEGNIVEWKRLKGKKALEYWLLNMLTIARHYAIIGFFTHSFDTFPVNIRQQFGCIIFLTDEAIEQFCREQTYGHNEKAMVRQAHAIALHYKHYKAVFFPNPDVTTHKQRFALFKANYYYKPLPIGVATYQAVMRNIQLGIADYQARNVHQAQIRIQEQKAREDLERLASQSDTRSAPPKGAGRLDALLS